MADIVEVVHKITYDIDDRALVNVTRVLQVQVQELQELNRSFADLQKQIQATATTEKHLLAELSNKADALFKRLEVSAGKTKGVLEQLGSGLLKGLGGGEGLEGIVSKFIEPAMGKIAKAATISELSVAGLGAELLSFGNVVTAGIGLLSLFADELLSNTKNAEAYGKALDAIGDEGERIGNASSDEMAKLFILRATIENVTLEYDKRKAAMDELLDLYPEYFKQLKEEDILVGKVGTAYADVVTNILNRARLEVFQENLKTNISSLEKVKAEIQKLKGSKISDKDLGMDPNMALFGSLPLYNIQSIDQAIPGDHVDLLFKKLAEYNMMATDINAAVANIMALQEELEKAKPHKTEAGNQGHNHNTPAKEKQEQTPELKIAVPNDAAEGEATVNDIQERALQAKRRLIQEELELDSQWEKEELKAVETRYANGIISFEDYEKEKLNIQKRYASLRRKAEIRGLDDILKDKGVSDEAKKSIAAEKQNKELEDIQINNAGKHNKDEETAKDKVTAEEKRQQRIKDTIKAYQDLAAEAVKAINTIYDAQIKVLDNEIKVREKRVEAAKKLAERGNAEALRLEEERLAAAQKKKEEYARREAILNAALAFSNHLNEPIIVKIFPDSGYDEQRIIRLQINPGRRAIVPNTIFYQTGSIPTRLAYYWATTDYKISNWSIDPWKKFWYDPTTPKRNIDIYGSDGNDKMNFFLNHMDDDYYVSIPPKNMDDSNDVRWEAIDAFDSLGNSVWNSLTAKDRKRSVALTWFKTGGYLPYGDTTGVYSQSFHYSITDTIGSYILNCDYYSGRYHVDIRLVTDCRPYANIVTHQKGRTYLILDNKPPYYLMAKQ